MITLELAKKYLNIDSAFTDDDTIIELFVEQAENAVTNFLNKEFDGDAPAAVKGCALRLVAYYYNNRTGVDSENIQGLKSVDYRHQKEILEDIIDYRKSAWLATT